MDGILSDKKTLTGIIFGIVIGLLVVAIFTAGFGMDEFVSAIKSFSWIYLLAGLAIYSLKWLAETVVFKTATSKFETISFRNCFKTTIATQFLNLVTPFMSGGQVATIYALKKSGLTIDKATSAMLIKSIMFQVYLLTFALVTIIPMYSELAYGAKIAAFVGIIINLFMIIFIILIGINRKLTESIVTFFIQLLEKLHLLKLDAEKKEGFYDNISRFNQTFYTFGKDWWRLLKLFCMSAVQFSLFNLSSLVVLKGFGLEFSLKNFLRIFLINISASGIPTPGTAGGAEGIYYLYMNQNIPNDKIAASIIIWRLCVYYIPLFVTGVLSFYFATRKEQLKKETVCEEQS